MHLIFRLFYILCCLKVYYSIQPTRSFNQYVILKCQNDVLQLSCPDYSSIRILNATFGRADQMTCPGICTDQTCINTHLKNCSSPYALQRYKDMCNDRAFCSVTVNDKTLCQDPCINTFKYSRVDYECVQDGPIKKVTACESTTLTLTCYGNQSIKIVNATYGRTDKTICYTSCLNGSSASICDKATSTTACKAPASSLDNGLKFCNGLTKCTFNVGNSIANGDPCSGFYKYIQISWSCI